MGLWKTISKCYQAIERNKNLTQPDIVLITVDCLRKADLDHLLSSASLNRILSYELPNHFANAPFTAGAFKSLFGAELPLDGESSLSISDKSVTLAERLKEVGYQIIGIHSNPLLRDRSFARGFDVYVDVARLVDDFNFLKAGISGLLYAGLEVIRRGLTKARLLYPAQIHARQATPIALEFIRKASNYKPLFVWVHYMDVHFPYGLSCWRFGARSKQKRDRFLNGEVTIQEMSYWRALYLNSLRTIGNTIAFLLSRIVGIRQGRKLNIVLTADHGDAFFEHGFVSHRPFLFDELIHVPVVSNVQLLSQDRKISSHLDLYNDICHLAQIDSVFDSNGDFVHIEVLDDFFNDSGYPIVGCRTLSEKLILSKEGTFLYDLEADPKEQHPIIISAHESNMAYLSYLQERYANLTKQGFNSKSNYDSETAERLRGLGYL